LFNLFHDVQFAFSMLLSDSGLDRVSVIVFMFRVGKLINHNSGACRGSVLISTKLPDQLWAYPVS